MPKSRWEKKKKKKKPFESLKETVKLSIYCDM